MESTLEAVLYGVQELGGLVGTATRDAFALVIVDPPRFRGLGGDPNDGPVRTHDFKGAADWICRGRPRAGREDGPNGYNEQRLPHLQASRRAYQPFRPGRPPGSVDGSTASPLRAHGKRPCRHKNLGSGT
jgi:hypothetical protein